MRYYTPTLHLYDEVPPRTISDKLGGEPDGFPAALWPCCAQCGAQQNFLAQFDHDDARLNLGRPGRRIYLFECMNPGELGCCETWMPDQGTNAAIIVEPEAITATLTSPPSMHEGVSASDESELLISNWLCLEDTQISEPVSCSIKLGGDPDWIQSEEADPAKWRFLGELEDYHPFHTNHKELLEMNTDMGIHVGNFGTGLGYFFIERQATGSTPKAILLWQC